MRCPMIVETLSIQGNDIYSDEHITVRYVSGEVTIECTYNYVYGLGERYNHINHKGKKVENVVEEKFCHQGEKTYFPLPFFMLDNGYGFFVESKKELSFDLDMPMRIKNLDVKKDRLVILKGSYKECIKDFLTLTGATKKAPDWVFGPWISAHRWNSQKMVEAVQEKLRTMDFPITALVLEQWSDEATFYIFNGATYPDKEVLAYEDFSFEHSPWPDPKAMIDKLHDDGIKLLLWQCPVVKYIPEEEPYNLRHAKEWERAQKERLVLWAEDKPYFIPKGHWFNGSMVPDFTNPQANQWWFNNRQYLLDIGVDGFKTDGGEFIYSEVTNHVQENQQELKNNYSLEYVRAYSQFLGDNRVAFSRAGYVGQQTYSLQWAGDQKSTYDELKAIYRAGINASLCGQMHWGFDIGGFAGELPSLDLYYRANQLALFSPIMQVHSEPVGGQFSATDPTRAFNNERTPWNMAGNDAEVLDDIRRIYNMRMNLLPYIYCEYLKALEQKTTLMKHMNIDYIGVFPEEQFLFGDLIIAPILSKDQSKVQVVLPEGDYYDLFTQKKVRDKVFMDHLSIKDMVAFVPEGTAIVTQKSTLMPESMTNALEMDTLYFHLYGETGTYNYKDKNNALTITWTSSEVDIEGDQTSQINWQRVL